MAIGFVTQSAGSSGGVASTSINVAYTSQAGNTLVIFVGRSGGLSTGALSGVTDSAGQTWQLATRGAVSGVANTRIECWYVVNSQAITQVTLNSAASQFFTWNISEWSGIAGLSATSPDNSATVSGTDCPTPVISANAGDLVIGAFQTGNTATITLNTAGFQPLTNFDSTTTTSDRAAYQVVSAGGSYNVDWTLSVAHAAGVITAAFKADPGAPFAHWQQRPPGWLSPASQPAAIPTGDDVLASTSAADTASSPVPTGAGQAAGGAWTADGVFAATGTATGAGQAEAGATAADGNLTASSPIPTGTGQAGPGAAVGDAGFTGSQPVATGAGQAEAGSATGTASFGGALADGSGQALAGTATSGVVVDGTMVASPTPAGAGQAEAGSATGTASFAGSSPAPTGVGQAAAGSSSGSATFTASRTSAGAGQSASGTDTGAAAFAGSTSVGSARAITGTEAAAGTFVGSASPGTAQALGGKAVVVGTATPARKPLARIRENGSAATIRENGARARIRENGAAASIRENGARARISENTSGASLPT